MENILVLSFMCSYFVQKSYCLSLFLLYSQLFSYKFFSYVFFYISCTKELFLCKEAFTNLDSPCSCRSTNFRLCNVLFMFMYTPIKNIQKKDNSNFSKHFPQWIAQLLAYSKELIFICRMVESVGNINNCIEKIHIFYYI